MATKDSSTRSTPRSGASSKPKHPEKVLNAHPFAPESKVQIHDEAVVSIERGENREPAPEPRETVSVNKQGQLKVSLPPGSYVAAAEVGPQWEYVAFTLSE